MKTIIDKQLQAIEKALRWSSNVPEAEQLQFRQDLINIRRILCNWLIDRNEVQFY